MPSGLLICRVLWRKFLVRESLREKVLLYVVWATQGEVFYSTGQGSLLRANGLVQIKLSVHLGEKSLPIAHVGYIYQAISGSESGH